MAGLLLGNFISNAKRERMAGINEVTFPGTVENWWSVAQQLLTKGTPVVVA